MIESTRARQAVIATVLLWPVATLLDIIFGGAVIEAAEMALLSVLLVGGILIVFRVVSRDDGKQTDKISAAVFGYLLMTLAFALFYVRLEEAHPGSFDFGKTDSHISSLVYFSLVTITTLGFGDITPVPPASKGHRRRRGGDGIDVCRCLYRQCREQALERQRS